MHVRFSVTRTTAGEIEHLVDICLNNKPTTSGLKEALAEFQVNCIEDLLALTSSMISSLDYTTDAGTKKVPKWATRALVQLKSFIYFQRSDEKKDYFSYTFEDYEKYLTYSYNPDCPHTAPAPTPDASESLIPPSKLFKGPCLEGKTESEVLFHHMFKNVLKQADDSNIMKALERAEITDIFELHDFTIFEIRSFQYIDKYGEFTTLNRSESMLLGLLRCFLQLNAAEYSNGYNYLANRYDDFDKFCIEFGF